MFKINDFEESTDVAKEAQVPSRPSLSVLSCGCAGTIFRIKVEALTVALSLSPQEKLEKVLRSDKNKRKTLKWAMTGDSNEPKFLCNAQASKRASLRA